MSRSLPTPIEHVVVVMMENRSFDHLLGYLDQGHVGPLDEERDSVPADPRDPSSLPVYVRWRSSWKETDEVPVDPGHGFADVMSQLTGSLGPWQSPYSLHNNGFAWNYATRSASPEGVMACFPEDMVPVISTLARSFAVCTRWHCSLPSETWPNRLFVHAGSSLGTTRGFLEHGWRQRWRELRAKTIFTRLEESDVDSRLYVGDVSTAFTFGTEIMARWRPYPLFRLAVERDKLPAYSFIEPSHYLDASSQHWPQDIRAGEAFLADVYTTLRNHRSVWEKTLLLVTYDEHGGFYDRVTPPEVDATDDIAEDPFLYDLLGPRVPALVISPLVGVGTVDHEHVYDHTSVPATVREIFGITKPLSPREGNAQTVTHLVGTDPRSDDECPDLSAYVEVADGLEAIDEASPPDGLQLQLLAMMQELDPEVLVGPVDGIETKADAFVVVEEFIRRNRPEPESIRA